MWRCLIAGSKVAGRTTAGRTAAGRRAAGLALGLVVLGGCSLDPSGTAAPRMPGSTGDRPSSGPASTSPSSPVHVTGPAVTVLDGLRVKGRAAMTGYDRAAFGPAWADADRNGCDTRNDILARDLDQVTYKPGTRDCVVLTGVLPDPYTGQEITFRRGQGTSSKVQIDHVVALAGAWQTGAARWTGAMREQLANDRLNLVAVDGSANESKGDGDAATWLPPNKRYRCTYVARQIAVKAAYQLWVTPAEKAAMIRILGTCPAQRLPVPPRP